MWNSPRLLRSQNELARSQLTRPTQWPSYLPGPQEPQQELPLGGFIGFIGVIEVMGKLWGFLGVIRV